MRVRRISCIAVFLILILLIPLHASAKLVIIPPDKMLDEATLIVTGEVTKLESSPKDGINDIGTIQVDKILKGSLDTNIIELQELGYMDKTVTQGIPPVGTKVFVLLKEDENIKPYFFSDSDHIGIIKDDKIVEVYKGINVTVHPYIETYNKYYQEHKAAAKVFNNEPKAEKNVNAKVEPTVEKRDSKALNDRVSPAVLILVFLGVSGITILLIFIFKKRKY